MDVYSDYDTFAWVYNGHWGSQFTPTSTAVTEKLVLPHLGPRARILDLCCGTGQFDRLLSERGYDVTGIDGSGEMLRYAAENAPGVEFIRDDARTFRLRRKQDAVVSFFDSLNHVMEPDELAQVFRHVFSCLKPGGLFLFDMYLEHGYLTTWKGHYGIVEDDLVCLFPNRYDRSARVGTIDFTIFRFKDDAWWRSDLALTQRCYPTEDILAAVQAAGFTGIQTYAHDQRHGLKPLGPQSNRGFFFCRKPAGT